MPRPPTTLQGAIATKRWDLASVILIKGMLTVLDGGEVASLATSTPSSTACTPASSRRKPSSPSRSRDNSRRTTSRRRSPP